jgi:putative endonuclease
MILLRREGVKLVAHGGGGPNASRARRVRTRCREGILVNPVVYLLRCVDGSLYCGWTKQLDARLEMHRTRRGSKYVAGRLPVEVAAVLPMPDRAAAMREEARIKRLTRAQKEALLAGRGACVAGVEPSEPLRGRPREAASGN